MAERRHKHYTNKNKYDRPDSNDIFLERPPDKESDYWCRGVIELEGVTKTSMGRKTPKTFKGKATRWLYCSRRAGQDTSHQGIGRCRYCEGDMLPDPKNRYSLLLNEELRLKVYHFLNDDNITDLRPELAMTRSLLEIWVNEAKPLIDATLAWHASFDSDHQGLHDYPLYHVGVHRLVMAELIEEGVHLDDLTDKQLNDRMIKAHQQWKEEFVEASRPDIPVGKGGLTVKGAPTKSLDFTTTAHGYSVKPRKIPEWTVEATKLLTVTGNLVEKIQNSEKDTHMSEREFFLLMQLLMEVVRDTVNRNAQRQNPAFDRAQATDIVKQIAVEFQTRLEPYTMPRGARKMMTPDTLTIGMDDGE